MSTWTTDVRHLAPAHEPQEPVAARHAELVRAIVEAATSRRAEGAWSSAVRCIARVGRKACSGRLHVAQLEKARVAWSCAACGESGVITGFEGTDLDLSSYADCRDFVMPLAG